MTIARGNVTPPAAPAGMTWDEAETIMRQLQKELQAAEKAHSALRKAREADEAVKTLTAEQERLQRALEALRGAIAAEQAKAQGDHAARAQTYVNEQTAHEADLARRRQEIDDLNRAAAQAETAATRANAERDRVLADIDRETKAKRRSLDETYAAAAEAARGELSALEAERQRVATALRELKDKVAALA